MVFQIKQYKIFLTFFCCLTHIQIKRCIRRKNRKDIILYSRRIADRRRNVTINSVILNILNKLSGEQRMVIVFRENQLQRKKISITRNLKKVERIAMNSSLF